jgi:hypothetical protein
VAEDNETIQIPLSQGQYALIDRADLPLIASHGWSAHWKRHARTFYAVATIYYQQVSMHRLIMDAPKGKHVDHRNHNGLDNRRSNLRLATPAQNVANNRPRRATASGYRGVSWQNGQWVARINIDGRRRFLGGYADPWVAAQVWNRAAVEAWGEFALLNEKRD